MPRRAESSEPLLNPRLFRRSLQRWYARAARDLPWRWTSDPYAILVSEFMLQQTQVATVIPYFHRWLERFPGFASLAFAREAEVLHAWQGLGYYTRARNLHAAAGIVMRNFEGKLPGEVAKIEKLPGVGRYTAGAIAAFAFDRSEPIVDANIARLFARLTNWEAPIDTAPGRLHLWQTAATLLPKKGARVYNSALLDLGALICLPRRPRCGQCPVRSHCRAISPASLPRKKKKPPTIRLTESHSFTRTRGRILLEQSRVRWRGMWILPRLTLAPEHAPLLTLDFPFTHHRITLAVFARANKPAPNEHHQWFPLSALARLPVPSPHRRALTQLLPPLPARRALRRP